MAELIPPQEMGVVYQMAEMGDLVLPYLPWRAEYGWKETDRILTLLGLVEDDEAKRLIEGYAGEGVVSPETIDSFMRALDYENDKDLTKRVSERLKARRSTYFWKDRPRARLCIGSRSLLRYSDFLPEPKWLIFDGRGNLTINEALATEWLKIGRMKRLSIVSAGNFVGSKFERFSGLEEIDFADSFLEDIEFLAVLPRLRVIRLIESELADWGALEYANLDELYIAGTSVAGAVSEESNATMAGAASVFLDMDCIAAVEERKGAGLDELDTWEVELWRQHDVRTLREELGL